MTGKWISRLRSKGGCGMPRSSEERSDNASSGQRKMDIDCLLFDERLEPRLSLWSCARRTCTDAVVPCYRYHQEKTATSAGLRRSSCRGKAQNRSVIDLARSVLAPCCTGGLSGEERTASWGFDRRAIGQERRKADEQERTSPARHLGETRRCHRISTRIRYVGQLPIYGAQRLPSPCLRLPTNADNGLL